MNRERPSFHEVPVQYWKDLPHYQSDNWLFRGQACSQWALRTSLERACQDQYVKTLDEAPALEKRLIREFQRRYHHYVVGRPEPVGIEWLSIMQHYGAPTRLLDWTYSIYVAAYFAVEVPCKTDEGKLSDCAIWCVNSNWVRNEGIPLFEASGKDAKYLKEEDKDKAFQQDFFCSLTDKDNPGPECVLPAQPWKLDERLTIQKGIFLSPGDVRKSFENNLCKLKGFDDSNNLLKLIIPHPMRSDALSNLHSMNISRASLFPGLDGFAQSLKIYHPKANR